jgi:hypothetical protein
MTLWFKGVSIKIMTNALLQLFEGRATKVPIQDFKRKTDSKLATKEQYFKVKTNYFLKFKLATVAKVQGGTLSSSRLLINSKMIPSVF